jgi:hypothetical protein
MMNNKSILGLREVINTQMVVAIVEVKERALLNIPNCNNSNTEQKMKILFPKKIHNLINQKNYKIAGLKQVKNRLKLEL